MAPVVAKDQEFNRIPPRVEIPKARRANREDGDDLNRFENKVATYLDQQARLFFWYRNRARKDYCVQRWEPGRIYAEFIHTLGADEPGTDDGFHGPRRRDPGCPPQRPPRTRSTSARSSTSAPGPPAAPTRPSSSPACATRSSAPKSSDLPRDHVEPPRHVL